MKRSLRIIITVVSIPLVALFLVVVVVLAYVFWPRHATKASVESALAQTLADNVDSALCHLTPPTIRVVHPDFAKKADFDGRYGSNPDITRMPFAKLTLFRWSHGDKGTGSAHVEGKAVDWWDMHVLSNTPCSVDVRFDYSCAWKDNGNSRAWACDVTNVVAK